MDFAKEIILKLRYRVGTKTQVISIQTEEESLTVEELANLFSEKMANNYKAYVGTLSKKEYEKYKFGQYKLVLQYLEVKI